MKKMMAHLRHGWFHWIGGACLLVGSLVAGSVGIASSATTAPTTTVGPTVNQGAPGTSPWPVTTSGNVGLSGSLPTGTNNIGNVGISGSLPAGTNNIGTVHVAAPNLVAGNAFCRVPDGFTSCSTGAEQPNGTIFNTLSVSCNLAPGQHAFAAYGTPGGGLFIGLPQSLQESAGGTDFYTGTLTNLGVPTGPGDDFEVHQDYTAGSGNGAACELSYTGTKP
jgi:hypothetical protein